MENQPFPKYLMKIDGRRVFLSLSDAAKAFDSGMADVQFGRYVMRGDFTVERMEEIDRQNISRLADQYSASK